MYFVITKAKRIFILSKSVTRNKSISNKNSAIYAVKYFNLLLNELKMLIYSKKII